MATDKKQIISVFGIATLSLTAVVAGLNDLYRLSGGARALVYYVVNPGSPATIQQQLSVIRFRPASVVICLTATTFIHAAHAIPSTCSVIILDSPLELSIFDEITPLDYSPDNPWIMAKSFLDPDWACEVLLDVASRVSQGVVEYAPHRANLQHLKERIGLSQVIDLLGVESGSLLSALTDLTTISSKRLRIRVRRSLAEYLIGKLTLQGLKRRLEEPLPMDASLVSTGTVDQPGAYTPEELSKPAITHLITVLTNVGEQYRKQLRGEASPKKSKDGQLTTFELTFLRKMMKDELATKEAAL